MISLKKSPLPPFSKGEFSGSEKIDSLRGEREVITAWLRNNQRRAHTDHRLSRVTLRVNADGGIRGASILLNTT